MPESSSTWIESLYNRTWEMELLLSGFALVLIFQSFDVYYIINHWAEYQIADGEWQFIVKGLSVVWWFSCVAICIFLIINLAFRAYWIALIGLMSGKKSTDLDYRFSANASHDEKLKKKYKGITEHIQDVDNKGSQIFAVAFLIICFTFSIVLFFTQLRLFSSLLQFAPSFKLPILGFVVVYSVMALLFFIDVLFSGVLRRRAGKLIAGLVYYNYQVIRITLLVFLYERLMLNVQKSSRVSGYIALSVTISFFIWVSFQDERGSYAREVRGVINKHNSRSYLFTNLETFTLPGHLTNVAMETDVLNELPLAIRVPLTKSNTRLINQSCPHKEIEQTYQKCLSRLFDIHINESAYPTRWVTKFDIKRRTLYLASYIAPEHLEPGAHTISISLPQLENPLNASFWYYPRD